MVTGDAAVCREGRELLGPGLTTVEVKQGIGRFSARQLPALRARELIEEGARKALSDLGAVAAVRPRLAVRDPGRVHAHGRLRRVRAQAGRRAHGRPDDRLARRRLVVGLAPVLPAVRLEVVEGDIAALDVDAVANAANDHLWMGAGVAGALKRAGGAEIEREAVAKGPIPLGSAVETGAGRLPARWVLHGAVMGQDLRTNGDLVGRTTVSCLAARG